MATIPLMTRPPEIANPLDVQAKAEAVRGSMLQNALAVQRAPLVMAQGRQAVESGALEMAEKRAAMRDQQILAQAYMQSGGDLDKTSELARQAGVRPQTLMSLEKQRRDIRDSQLRMSKEQLDVIAKQNELFRGKLQSILSADDGTPEGQARAAGLYQQELAALPEMVRSGQLSAEVAAGIPRTYPGAPGLRQMSAHLATQKQILDEALSVQHTSTLKAQEEAARNKPVSLATQYAEAVQAAIERGADPMQDATAKRYLDAMKATKVTDGSQTEEQLTARALKGDKEAQAILDAMQKRKIAIGAAARTPSETREAIDLAAQSIAAGDLTSIRDITTMRGDQRLQLYAAIKRINPRFDTASLQRKIKMQEDVDVGKESQQIKSFGTFLEHAGAAKEVGDEIYNSSVPAFNTPLNLWRKKFSGDPKLMRLLVAYEAPKKEFETFLLNNRAMYAEDRRSVDILLDPNASPAMKNAAISQMGHTAAARYNNINHRYKRVMGKDIENPFSEEAARAAEKIGVKLQANLQQAGAETGTTPSFQVKAPNGKTYYFNSQAEADSFKKSARIP